LNLSGNEITSYAAKQIVSIMWESKALGSLKIGVNSFGSQFDDFVDFVRPFAFVDPGTESDDQGSLSDDDQDQGSLNDDSELDQLNDGNGRNYSSSAATQTLSQLSFQGQQLKLNTAQDGKLQKY
jgi:hypothetical protein